VKKRSSGKARTRGNLRAMILAAAEDLFAEGYAQFSMRKLARRIGYSATTIYLYFEDQDELFSALIEENFARLLDAFAYLESVEDPVEKLRALGRTYVRFGIENPQHYRVLFMVRPDLDAKRPARGRLAQLAWRHLRKAVEAVLENSKNDQIDSEVASYALWAGLHGLVSLVITSGEHMTPKFVGAVESLMIEAAVAGLVA
jgi:AcrR family transcriptional regulator